MSRLFHSAVIQSGRHCHVQKDIQIQVQIHSV